MAHETAVGASPLRREWRQGLVGLARWIRTPSDLPNAFGFVFSLAGPTLDREFRSFAQHPVGRKLLAESPRRDLNALLGDREMLSSMPEGSLGRAYLDYLGDEGMASADAFLDAARLDEHARRLGWSDDQLWFVRRMANSHDLFHVISGYDRSIVGEIGVNVYTTGQIPLLPLKLVLPYYAAMSPGQLLTWLRFLRAAYQSGRQTPSLSCADYEAMLPLQLDEVRERLGAPLLSEVHPNGLPEPGRFLRWLVRRVEKLA